jgi:release factor glutamine methyltransferase
MTTVDAMLAQARTRGVDRLDAQLLLAHLLGVGRAWLMAHGDAPLSAEQARACAEHIERRADGVPLAYLVGRREFHGIDLLVTPSVLDPRPDTETLVDWALELLAEGPAAARSAVDLGTGSGAIALAVKRRCPGVAMHASDLSEAALEVARANARRLALDIAFAHGDWWNAWPGRRFALALSNPPYIAQDDPHLAALRHEPRSALTAGADGLAAIDRIVSAAPDHLVAGAWLLMEHGYEQGDAVRARLLAKGFRDVATRADLAGQPRCSGGRWDG